MGLLFKLVLYTFIFAFVVYVFKMIARLAFKVRATVTDVNKLKEAIQAVQGAAQGRQKVSADMVRCKECGSFVVAKEVIIVSSGQHKETFCSRDCMQRHTA